MERTSNIPSFFKVLVKNDFSTQLSLPVAFVKKFGAILLDKCVLQIYSNQSWEVDVVKVNGHMYFTKGWDAFVKDNRVEWPDFVVFKFAGNSTFEVRIYGTDCCEKRHYMGNETIYIDSDPSIDKGIGKCKGSIKKQRRDEHVKCGAKSLEEAKRFKSECPFFRIAMKKAYVKNSYVNMTTKFYKKYMNKDVENVELQISGRVWTVGLLHIQQSEYNTARFSAGWKQFAKDNELKIGDNCVFELRRKHSALFEVHIFRCRLGEMEPSAVLV